jgi:DNA-binding protein YbaB
MTFGSADEMIARVNAQVQEAQDRAAQATQFRAGVESVRGRALSPRGEVEVEADASGRLTDITLAAAALAHRPDVLGRLIVQTSHQAHQRAGEQAVQLAADAFGEDSETVSRLRDEVARRVGPEPAGPSGATIDYR